MSSELILNWGEHDSSLKKILLSATLSLRIFDEDLTKLKLEQSDTADFIRNFLNTDKRNTLQIVVRNAEPFRSDSPRLMRLLATYTQNMTVIACPPHLAALSDSLFIVDDRHALVRFHKDGARSKVILDSAEQCAPYVHRFDEILREGGEQVSASTLGL
ncbi:hypothetical protein [Propionivibrio sp.]|uniref:DUF7931 domain-containing protein n=1 Tax=Propionivibrio sp. TaxID=2212460 RepID=UPI0025D85155|nr:hypothetical protein [Propionivibrio sp.]MBK7356586.1 hypothetical protein [Propionivibrio sp.]MBK8400999.1 hypothetical protein [Propionivibrio sp.]MBK8744170.1 hypothetical protein [Propionivibrio sp.]MBK8894284.1 hypothetical protein [Propionivibrio sp.]